MSYKNSIESKSTKPQKPYNRESKPKFGSLKKSSFKGLTKNMRNFKQIFSAKANNVNYSQIHRQSTLKQTRSKSSAIVGKNQRSKKRIIKDNYISNQIRGYMKRNDSFKRSMNKFTTEFNHRVDSSSDDFESGRNMSYRQRNTTDLSCGTNKQNLKKTLREILSEKVCSNPPPKFGSFVPSSPNEGSYHKLLSKNNMHNSVGYFNSNNKSGLNDHNSQKKDQFTSFDQSNAKVLEIIRTASKSELDSKKYEKIFKEKTFKRKKNRKDSKESESNQKNFEKLLQTPSINTDRYLHFKNNYAPKTAFKQPQRNRPMILGSNLRSTNDLTRNAIHANQSMRINSLGKDFGVLDSESEEEIVKSNNGPTKSMNPRSRSFKMRNSHLENRRGRKIQTSKKKMKKSSSFKKPYMKEAAKGSLSKSVKFGFRESSQMQKSSIHIEDQFSLKSKQISQTEYKQRRIESTPARSLKISQHENIEESKVNLKTATISDKRNGLVKAFAVNTIPSLENSNEDFDRLSLYFNSRTVKTKQKSKTGNTNQERCRIPIGFFGLYQGKDNKLCSEFMKKHLHHQIFKNRNFPRDIKKAIREGVKETETAFRNWFLGKISKATEEETILSGSSNANILIIFGKLKSNIRQASIQRFHWKLQAVH